MLCSLALQNEIQYLGLRLVTLKFGLFCVLSNFACMRVLTKCDILFTRTCRPKLISDDDVPGNFEKIAWLLKFKTCRRHPCCECHIVLLCWFTTLVVRNSPTPSVPAWNPPVSQILPTRPSSSPRTVFTDYYLDRFFWAISVFVFSSFPFYRQHCAQRKPAGI